MHLVRNSIDHGIETREERALAGKPKMGEITLNAYHDSGSIVIEVSDDGRGLDRDRIRQKAIKEGLIRDDDILSDEEICNLIFEPGFSTASAVTDISGRGVGMDVVKQNIESLRGTIRLLSILGKGTVTQIRLPLTLAIIDGFLVAVGKVYYVVPLDMMVECIVQPNNKKSSRDGLTGYFDLRGEIVPYLDLRRHFGVSLDAIPIKNSMIVVKNGSNKLGLIVDRLLGQHQTVIKPLGTLFEMIKGISGSTILGSGEIALILDIVSLATSAMSIAKKKRQDALSELT